MSIRTTPIRTIPYPATPAWAASTATISTWRSWCKPKPMRDVMSYCSPVWISDYTYRAPVRPARLHRQRELSGAGLRAARRYFAWRAFGVMARARGSPSDRRNGTAARAITGAGRACSTPVWQTRRRTRAGAYRPSCDHVGWAGSVWLPAHDLSSDSSGFVPWTLALRWAASVLPSFDVDLETRRDGWCQRCARHAAPSRVKRIFAELSGLSALACDKAALLSPEPLSIAPLSAAGAFVSLAPSAVVTAPVAAAAAAAAAAGAAVRQPPRRGRQRGAFGAGQGRRKGKVVRARRLRARSVWRGQEEAV